MRDRFGSSREKWTVELMHVLLDVAITIEVWNENLVNPTFALRLFYSHKSLILNKTIG